MCRGARARPPILPHPYTHSLHLSFLSVIKGEELGGGIRATPQSLQWRIHYSRFVVLVL